MAWLLLHLYKKAGAGGSFSWQGAQLGQEDEILCWSCKNRAGTAELYSAVDQSGHICLVSTEVKCFTRSPDSAGLLYHLVPYWLEMSVQSQLRSSSPPEVGVEASAEGSCVLPVISYGFGGMSVWKAQARHFFYLREKGLSVPCICTTGSFLIVFIFQKWLIPAVQNLTSTCRSHLQWGAIGGLSHHETRQVWGFVQDLLQVRCLGVYAATH